MPSNVPVTLETQISEGINVLISESDGMRNRDESAIVALHSEISKLQKVNAREAFVRFGSLAALCGDVEGTLANFKKALMLPDQENTNNEYWTSLINIGLFAKAKEIGVWLLEPRRGFFLNLWRRALFTGLLLETWRLLPEAKKVFPELANEDFSQLASTVDVMKKCGLKDQDVISVLDLMGEIQRAHRIMFHGKLASQIKVMHPPEDSAYLYLVVPVDVASEELRNMNRELAHAVVTSLEQGRFPQGISAAFAKAFPVQARIAA